MLEIVEVFYYSAHFVLSSIKSPLYWVVVFIVYLQYRKLGKMEQMVLGSLREPLYKRMITSVILGILGGIVASMIFTVLGTTVNERDFIYILPTAILLSLIHPRFICFSYAGGLISLISLTLGRPNIDVVSIMTVIAVLHFLESLLIIIDGHNERIPIFMEKDGQLVGGFNMSRFWPLPFMVLIDGKIIYPMVIIAVLGYGDYVLTKYPKTKTRETAVMLMLFSFILLSLSQLSTHYGQLKYVLAITSPLLHELIIQFGRKCESKRKPIFLPSAIGLKILDTIPNGVGEKMGLKTGDILLKINGQKVNSKVEIVELLKFRPKYIWIDVLDIKKGLITKEYEDLKGIDSLEVLVIPKDPEFTILVEEVKSPLITLLDKIKHKK